MIVAVAGGKGGVGTTTVAYNLGAALDRRGVDSLVVDADLGMADLPPSRGPDLHDVLAGRADPVEAVREDGPVPLLPCGRSLHGARASAIEELGTALEAVGREYGVVVVDCPPGMKRDVGAVLGTAETTVLVTRPTDAAVAAAVRLRGLAVELDAGLCGVALNRARADSEWRSRVESALGAPVVPIPRSAAVERAMRAGQPVTAADGQPFETLGALVHSVSST